jgi:hypothetical protein
MNMDDHNLVRSQPQLALLSDSERSFGEGSAPVEPSVLGKLLANRRGLIFFFALLMSFSMWFFVDRIWAPPMEIHFSDLYPRWYGSRELLLHGRDPYGPEVSREIQQWAYGHELVQNRAGEPKDEDRFAYPLYMSFLLAPFVGLPFVTVQNIFRWILPAVAVVSSWLWLGMLRFRSNRQVLGALILLSLFSFPVLESIYIQQPVLLSAALLAGSGAALSKGRLWLAGTLLALATIKPQLTVLLVGWLLVWAISDWQRRKNLVWGFSVTMLVLFAGSEALLPGWIGKFVAGAVAYQHYTGNASVLELLLTRPGAAVASVVLVIFAGFLIWPARHAPSASPAFDYAFSLIVILTLAIVPTLYPTGQVMLAPAIFLTLKNARRTWEAGRVARLTYVGTLSLIGWPWLGAVACLIASFAIPLDTIRRFWIVPVSTLPLVPLGLLLLFVSQSRGAFAAQPEQPS